MTEPISLKQTYRYPALSDDMRRLGLYLVGGGYTFIPPYTAYPPRPHPADHYFRWRQGRTLDEYQVIYIIRGSGTFESSAGGVRALHAGCIYVLFPGEWHRYAPDQDTGWDEYWLAFNGHTAGALVGNSPFTLADPIVDVSTNELILDEYVRAVEELRAEAVGYQGIVASRTRVIFALASAVSERRAYHGTERLRIIELAKCLLLERVEQPVNVEDMAAELNVGYSAFRRMFRDYTGLAPAQYHLQLRLTAARELLRTTTLPVAAVAERMGFASAYYFTRIFREKNGVTPSTYRSHSQAQPAGVDTRSPSFTT